MLKELLPSLSPRAQPLVVGTIAFDILIPVVNSIREEHQQRFTESVNLAFVAGPSQIVRGGTAANICYNLALLQQHPLIFSVVGEDFQTHGFQDFLEDLGVDIAVHSIPLEKTARCYQISDNSANQITIWQSNAYDRVDIVDLSEKVKQRIHDIPLAIFSTGNPVGILRHMRELRTVNPASLIIFNPGPRIVSYSPQKFSEGLDYADLLAVNVSELNRLAEMGYDEADLLEELRAIIVTKGERGSEIISREESVSIGIAQPSQTVETTGAGDAYKAGLITGLLKGKDLASAAVYGSALASFSVEQQGGQSHRPPIPDVEERAKTVPIKRK